MKILIIRHGDPDYTTDSLTEKGFREAELLSERIKKLDVKAFYVSPLGRAQATAVPTLKKMDRKAQTFEWLREFQVKINRPDKDQPIIAWDWLPSDWTAVEEYFDRNRWMDTKIMRDGRADEEYRWVTENFDELLSSHGYRRSGAVYQVTEANNDTIVLFCHFGLECVLLSHLLNVSPMVLWHGMCAAPSSVTTVVTEERRAGTASFRMTAFGDISHLYVADEPPSARARFCECYDNASERHD